MTDKEDPKNEGLMQLISQKKYTSGDISRLGGIEEMMDDFTRNHFDALRSVIPRFGIKIDIKHDGDSTELTGVTVFMEKEEVAKRDSEHANRGETK